MLGLFRWTTAACLLSLLAPAILQAQYPRARRGQFEVHGLDFRRDGGWRNRVAAVRSARHRLLRARAFGSLNLGATLVAGNTKVTGRVIVPVIPIAFQNVAPPFPESHYNGLFFSPVPTGRPYSLKTFYEQVSNGNITITGRVFNWVTADQPDTYYEDGCNGIGVFAPCPSRPVSRFGELLLQTLDIVSQGFTGGTVWSEFDNDGPDGRPNSGDDDGYVDFVTFLQPERDGACADSPNIWAHRFVVRAWNGGSPYVTRTPWAGHPGQFLKVDEYTMQSAVGGNSACDASVLMPIGTVAHEVGHVFGLPDLYDTDLNVQASQGIGEWGLMGSGNYARPYSPARFEAWSLFELGWVTVDTLSSGREVRLGPVASSDTVLYLPIPGTDEFYLLENRQAQDSDSAQMSPGFGVRQKAPGLLVWHVDQGQVDQHGFRADNRVNAGPLHGVALVQADGLDDLRRPGSKNRGDMGDSYPGASGNSSLCRTTAPPAADNQGGFAWFCIDGIRQVTAGGPVAFRYIAYRSVFASDHPGALIGINGALVSRLEQFFYPGTMVELSADSVQADPTGRTRFEFLAWSDGGGRTHSVIARETPDTIVAHVAAQHRLRMSVQGAAAAAVTSGVTGDIGSGIFVAEGARISLRAAPQAGSVFTGWTGDTTAARDTLTLSMAHPFDLTANFLAIQQVELASAAEALFGSSILGPEQTTYLDVVGNRNGLYDLGDFVAAVDRSGSQEAAPRADQLLAAAVGGGDR